MKFEEAKDIVYGIKPDYDFHHAQIKHLKATRGPSDWLEVRNDPEAFGPEEDYALCWSDEIDKWVFEPRSVAGREWAYYVFPQEIPRYGEMGFILDNPKFARIIKLGAERDGLMSLGDWIEANEEADEISRQWGDEDE